MSSSFLFLNFVVLLLHIQFISCSPAQCVRNTFYFDKDSICNTKCLQWITNSVEMRQVQDCSDHPERTPTICQSILETYNNTCQELVSKIIADDPVIDATCKAITSVEPCCQESKCFWIAEDHGIPEFPVRPFEIIYLLNFKCWKGNNRYCESLTTPFGLTLSSQADCPVSKDINYQPLCTDCLPTVAQIYSPILSYVTDIACINDQGDYCYNNSQPLPTLPEELRKRCNHSCPPDWILSTRLLHNDDEKIVDTLTVTSQAICLEENGQYCFEKLMKIGNNKNCDTCSPTCCNKCIGYCIPGCLKYVNPDNYDIVCVNPLSCDEVKSILNSTNGCCIDAYKKAISSPFDSDLDDLRTLGSYDAFEYTLNKCGIKDGSLPPCTTYVTKYPKTMTIKGNCSAIQNFDDIKKAVTIDLNNNVLCYGCAVDLAITCTPSPSSNANGDQIYISFSILGMNAERAQQYSKEYDSKSPIIPVVTMFYLESIGADIRN